MTAVRGSMFMIGSRATGKPMLARRLSPIADLDYGADIKPGHVVEAINYRSLDRKLWAR